MSPAGGVGVNLAIQDAVAAANVLTRAPRGGLGDEAVLARVQSRREFPTRVTQAAQVLIHKSFDFVFDTSGPLTAPWQLKAAVRIPGIHAALGVAVGIGVRPEHVGGSRRPFRAALVRAAAARAAARAFFGALVRPAGATALGRSVRLSMRGGRPGNYRWHSRSRG